jgi:ATP-dependent DNA ligase
LINPVPRAEPFDDREWLFEPKFDGFRAAADTVRGRQVSRNGNRMQQFEQVLDRLPKGHVFDGELVALDDAGRPLFNELHRPSASQGGSRLLSRRKEKVARSEGGLANQTKKNFLAIVVWRSRRDG